MKKKIAAMLLCVLMVVCALPVTVKAANFVDIFGFIYDESEYAQLKGFLNAPSAFAGDSNGERICGSVYSEEEPYNWHGVTWTPYTEGADTVYHVTVIDWVSAGSHYDLNGNLDLSGFIHLQSFQLDYAQIDGLDVTGDTELSTLECTHTKLTEPDGTVTHTGITSIDLSDNTNLSYVDLSQNSIASLDFSQMGAKLERLYCTNNALTSLNVSTNTNLVVLECSENNLAGALDLTDYAALVTLGCYSNDFTGLSVDGCAALVSLTCQDNDIPGSLDVADSPELLMLNCARNKLNGLDVGVLTKLIDLNCADNQLSTLDVSANAALTTLNCSDNQLNALNVSLNTKLETLYCQKNQIATLSSTGNAGLTALDCSGNELSALDVGANMALKILRCSGNDLGSLDVSLNTALMELDCSKCGLGALDLHTNAVLYNLICDGNTLGSLDVSANLYLNTLECGDCGLTTLNITGTNLMVLICADNDLTSLDTGSLKFLFLLDISGNQFTDLDLSSVTYFALDCTDNPLSHLKTMILYGFDPEDSKTVELTANGEGYVGLYDNLILPEATFGDYEYSNGAFAQGTPKAGAAFYDWTDASDAQVSMSGNYSLSVEADYDLTANFLSLAGTPADGKISTGGRITITPAMSGGIWSFNGAALSRNGNQFTGLQKGTFSVLYTLNGVSLSFDVTVQQSQLPNTGQDMTLAYVLAGLAVLALAAGIIWGMQKQTKRA